MLSKLKLKQFIWEWRGVLITAPSVTVLVIALRFLGLFQFLEWSAYDQMFHLRPRETRDSRIVIVGISETDLQELKQWPIKDKLLVELLQKIKQQKPRAIGLDIYRDLPVGSEAEHQKLLQLYRTTPNLIGIKKVVGGASGPAINPPPVLKEKGQISANDLPLDTDGKIRRQFLYLHTIESFGLKLALLYLQKEGIAPEPAKINPDYLQLGKAVFVPFEANDGGYVRTDAAGYQVILNFRGGRNNFKIVSLSDVLKNRIPSDLMRDRIVLIGSTAESLNDLLYTPYSSSFMGIPERTSGVEIHAHLTSMILSAALDNRPLIKTLPEWIEWLWILGGATIGAVLTWQWRYRGGVGKFSVKRTASILLIIGGFFLISYLGFLAGWWIPVIPPVIAFIGSASVIISYIARTAGEIRKTFSLYLTDDVVANLLESPDGFQLGGERRKVTILMSDLRGFSSVSEELAPETVVSMLNIYLGEMADVIMKYQGTIDEFIGDAILVLFGAPTQREDDAERAIACALGMQLAMDSVNRKNERLGLPNIEMGIGISTGEVVVGNIGSTKRAKYGVVGHHVNLAARIESYTVGGQILISESTLQEVKSLVQIDGEIQVQPKGSNDLINIYEVGGIGGKHNLYISKEESILVALKIELPIQYTLMDDKRIDGTVYYGSLIKLSENSAEIRTESKLETFKNIKINLINKEPELTVSGDIYAKVLKKSPSGDLNFHVRFTRIPADVTALLEEIYSQNAAGS
ncbi:adenylate/guanylate cyclase domain-containing protein [[Phormidium ambiguum] IAM M-71]|uniref:Adenylate/guanylate cyclase domain-containing protein n=1 Tax=[Phormidium ambiguum] IAM M-71 TaxID=454136 RepID=A0A1U7ISL3_9CYAN|nr:adenylate/guanylate cyclase domain-containing protein [Phormidium ambiguum]OKH40436.1 adenylate/guanylate cyclase domain-containing protein [Phormidium ambiguum IAM M-71]